jgi:hypothetical protein
MLEASFKVPEILGAYQDQVRRIPRTVETFVQNTVQNYIRQQIAIRVAPYPGPVVYTGPPGKDGQPTYNWKTPAQRRAFFAKMRALGLEPPYQRTGLYGESWDVVIDLTNLVIGIINDAQDPFGTYYAEFVGGPFQQPGHQDTGWIETQDPILQILIEALDILEEAWYDIISFESTLI